MTGLALTMRFLLELAAVVAVGAWGAHVAQGPARPVVTIALPLLFIVVWALVAAPKATNALSPVQREVAGSVLLLVAASGLALTGRTELAAAFAAAIAIDQAVLLAMPRETAFLFDRAVR